ncbi:MAG: flagellar biosynthesis protein FlhF [Pirellulaceae bacterium]|nr:flagellar biosynthesis protein FlhF [Planctomycetales bacterium]
MNIKSYRARTLHEALQMVRTDLGPDAAILQTREVSGNLLTRWIGATQVEVTASAEVHVPSRFSCSVNDDPSMPSRDNVLVADGDGIDNSTGTELPIAANHEENFRERFRSHLSRFNSSASHRHLPGADLMSQTRQSATMPDSLFLAYTQLLDADFSETLSRELVERIQAEASAGELRDPLLVRQRLLRMIEAEIRVQGPIQVTPGKRRLVALVGPTGVGKTTTIAKLAANFRLRERRNVGLITVDTYRIAAVEQLRTYADIIDLPMEVVSTPREMREAVHRLAHLDLVLLDTAGRSPRDDVRIQELKSMLQESRADEVHLVLSAVSGSSALIKTTQHFQTVGVTNLLLTKLDEASGLGNLLPLFRDVNLPLSYLTHGQNVPDDIQVAERPALTRRILGADF